MKKGRRFGDIVSNVYLILLSIVAVFPLLWLLVSAFKSSSEMLNNPTKIWPIQWTLANFKTVLFTLKFTVNIRNSLIIAGSTTVVAIIISSLAAYGVVRFFPKLGNVMTKILVTTYMFPSIMLVIPYAMVMAKLNLTNTRIGLMLVYLSFSVPYAVWMLVGFFKTVPIGIEEAARIDGANKLQVFVRIVLPLVSPGIVATVADGHVGACLAVLDRFHLRVEAERHPALLERCADAGRDVAVFARDQLRKPFEHGDFRSE